MLSIDQASSWYQIPGIHIYFEVLIYSIRRTWYGMRENVYLVNVTCTEQYMMPGIRVLIAKFYTRTIAHIVFIVHSCCLIDGDCGIAKPQPNPTPSSQPLAR